METEMETVTGMAATETERFAVILPAAGRSHRFSCGAGDGEETLGGAVMKKVCVELLGRPVWSWAAEIFAQRNDVARILLVVSPEDHELFERQRDTLVAAGHSSLKRVETVHGGTERGDSVRNALQRLNETPHGGVPHHPSDFGWVAIHDAARPCVTPDVIDRVFAAAVAGGAAILAVPVAATLKRIGGEPSGGGDSVPGVEWIGATISRTELREAQTPQVFRRSLFEAAYAEFERIFADGETPTDDARLMERCGIPVAMIRGTPMNLKITTPDDLHLARAILRNRRTEDIR